jgi:hypothetical protein
LERRVEREERKEIVGMGGIGKENIQKIQICFTDPPISHNFL